LASTRQCRDSGDLVFQEKFDGKTAKLTPNDPLQSERKRL
jgi:hypothetical protein